MKSITDAASKARAIELHGRLVSMWEAKFAPDDDITIPLTPIPPKSGMMLFIGMNPSFNLKAVKQLLANLYPDIDASLYFKWKNHRAFDPAVDISLQEVAKDKYPYFWKFDELAKKVHLEWDHLDICFIRETSQAKAMNLLMSNGKAGGELSSFGRNQFDMAMELIRDARPRVVVVANALASTLYKKYNELRFDDRKGFYPQEIGGKQVPVLLSSMFTGQRALDRYSFELLGWHVGRVLKEQVSI